MTPPTTARRSGRSAPSVTRCSTRRSRGAASMSSRTSSSSPTTPRHALELATVDILPPQRGLGEPAPPDPMEAQMRVLAERGVAFSIGVREGGHMRYLQRYRELGTDRRAASEDLPRRRRRAGPQSGCPRAADLPRRRSRGHDLPLVHDRLPWRPGGGHAAADEHARRGDGRTHPHGDRRQPAARREDLHPTSSRSSWRCRRRTSRAARWRRRRRRARCSGSPARCSDHGPVRHG